MKWGKSKTRSKPKHGKCTGMVPFARLQSLSLRCVLMHRHSRNERKVEHGKLHLVFHGHIIFFSTIMLICWWWMLPSPSVFGWLLSLLRPNPVAFVFILIDPDSSQGKV